MLFPDFIVNVIAKKWPHQPLTYICWTHIWVHYTTIISSSSDKMLRPVRSFENFSFGGSKISSLFVISGKHFFMWVGYFLRHSHFLSGRILSHKVIWRLLVHSLINCKFMVTLCLQVLNCWWHKSIVQLFLNFNSELQIIGMAKGFLVYVDTAALQVCFYTFLKTLS